MALPPILQDRLTLPMVAAPMFIISNPELVIAQCKAGVVGSFPALNARPAAQLEVWLQRITGGAGGSAYAPRIRQRPGATAGGVVSRGHFLPLVYTLWRVPAPAGKRLTIARPGPRLT